MCWQYALQNKSIDAANIQLSEILSWETLQPQKFTEEKNPQSFICLSFQLWTLKSQILKFLSTAV